MCQEIILNMSGTFLENVWNVSGMYFEVAWKVGWCTGGFNCLTKGDPKGELECGSAQSNLFLFVQLGPSLQS